MSDAAPRRTAHLDLLHPRGGDSPPTRRSRLVSLLLIAAATILVFAPTLSHQFVWDDHEQILTNSALRSWGTLARFWTQDVLAVTRPDGMVHSNYYRPLFFTQYLVYYKLFGLNATAWHAAAILQHILAGWAAMFLLLRLGCGTGVARLGALLFVLHPAHGESVSWLAASFNDPPVATLLMIALAAHARVVRWGRLRRLWLAALAYAAALAIKESALAMLLLAPLVEWFVRGEGPAARDAEEAPEAPGAGEGQLVPALAGVGRVSPALAAALVRWRWYAPYLIVTAAYFVARRLALGSFLGVYEGAKSWAELAPTFPWLALWYLRFLAWPFGLAPSYAVRALDGWSDPRAWGSLLALAALAGALWRFTRGRRLPRFAVLWTLCCIWPVFNVRSFRAPYLLHQRYLYLAALGLCLALAWWLVERLASRRLGLAAASAILLVWSASHLLQNGAWATDHALWTRIGQVDPGNPASFDYLGAEAMRAGKIDEADAFFHRAIAADSTSPMAYFNMGVVLQTRRDDPAGALAWYEQSIARFERRPDSNPGDEARCRLNAAACLSALGRRDEALARFVAIADTPPYLPDAAMNAALLSYQAGDLAGAKEILARCHKHHPSDLTVGGKLVELCLMKGDTAEAVSYGEALVRRLPDSAEAAAILKGAIAKWDAEQKYKGGVLTHPRSP